MSANPEDAAAYIAERVRYHVFTGDDSLSDFELAVGVLVLWLYEDALDHRQGQGALFGDWKFAATAIMAALGYVAASISYKLHAWEIPPDAILGFAFIVAIIVLFVRNRS